MYQYVYEGPVMCFDKCLSDRWTGSTFAPSKKKALSNIAYQYKKKNNLIHNVKISLPGKISIVRE